MYALAEDAALAALVFSFGLAMFGVATIVVAAETAVRVVLKIHTDAARHATTVPANLQSPELPRDPAA